MATTAEFDIILSNTLDTVITDNSSIVIEKQKLRSRILTKYNGEDYPASKIQITYNGIDKASNNIDDAGIYTATFYPDCIIGKNAQIVLTAYAEINGKTHISSEVIKVIPIQKDERCWPKPSVDTVIVNSDGTITPKKIGCNILRRFNDKNALLSIPYKNYYVKYSFSNKPEKKQLYSSPFELQPYFQDINDIPQKITFFLYDANDEMCRPLEIYEVLINSMAYTGYSSTATVDLDNEMDNIVVDNDYTVIEDTTISTNAFFYVGDQYGNINIEKSSIELNSFDFSEEQYLSNISIETDTKTLGILNIHINFKKGNRIPKKIFIDFNIAGTAADSNRIQVKSVRFLLNAVPSAYPIYELILNANAIKVDNENHREPVYISADRYKKLGKVKEKTDYGFILYKIDDGEPIAYEDEQIGIASSDIQKYVLFEYYDETGNMIDRETVFVIYDGTNGEDGITQKVSNIKKFYMATADTALYPTYNDDWTEDDTPENFSANNPYLWSYEETTYIGSDGNEYVSRTQPIILSIWAQDGIQGLVVRQTEFIKNTEITEQNREKDIQNHPNYKRGYLFFNDTYFTPGDDTVRYLDIVRFQKKWYRRIIPDNQHEPYTTWDERYEHGVRFPYLEFLKIFESEPEITTAGFNELINGDKCPEELLELKGCWEQLQESDPIVTPLIIADNAVLELAQGNEFLMMDKENHIVGGLSGYSNNQRIGSNVRIFVGTQIDQSSYNDVTTSNLLDDTSTYEDTISQVYYKKYLAPFRVYDDGSFVSNDATISGNFSHISPEQMYSVEIKNGEFIYGGNQPLSIIMTSRVCKNTPMNDKIADISNISSLSDFEISGMHISNINEESNLNNYIYNRQFEKQTNAIIPCIAFTNTQGKIVSCLDVTGFHQGPDVAAMIDGMIDTVQSETFNIYSGIEQIVIDTNNIKDNDNVKGNTRYDVSININEGSIINSSNNDSGNLKDICQKIIHFNNYDNDTLLSRQVPYNRLIADHAYNLFELNNPDILRIYSTEYDASNNKRNIKSIVTRSVKEIDDPDSSIKYQVINAFNKEITLYYKLGDRNRYYIDAKCEIPAQSGDEEEIVWVNKDSGEVSSVEDKVHNTSITANIHYAVESLNNITYVIDKNEFYENLLVNWDNKIEDVSTVSEGNDENSDITNDDNTLNIPGNNPVNISGGNGYIQTFNPGFELAVIDNTIQYDNRYSGISTWWGDKPIYTYNKGISYGINKTFRDIFPYQIDFHHEIFTFYNMPLLNNRIGVDEYAYIGHAIFSNSYFNKNHILRQDSSNVLEDNTLIAPNDRIFYGDDINNPNKGHKINPKYKDNGDFGTFLNSRIATYKANNNDADVTFNNIVINDIHIKTQIQDKNTTALQNVNNAKYKMRMAGNIAYNYYKTNKKYLTVRDFFGQFNDFYKSIIIPYRIPVKTEKKEFSEERYIKAETPFEGYTVNDVQRITKIGCIEGQLNYGAYYASKCKEICPPSDINNTIKYKSFPSEDANDFSDILTDKINYNNWYNSGTYEFALYPYSIIKMSCLPEDPTSNTMPYVRVAKNGFYNNRYLGIDKTTDQIGITGKYIPFTDQQYNQVLLNNIRKYNIYPEKVIGPVDESEFSKYILYREQILFENGYKKVYSTYWNAPVGWEPETDNTGIIYKRVKNFQPHKHIGQVLGIEHSNRFNSFLNGNKYVIVSDNFNNKIYNPININNVTLSN